MNADADTVSRYLVKLLDDMKEHTEPMSLGVVYAVCCLARQPSSPGEWRALGCSLATGCGNADVVWPENISSFTPGNIPAAQQEGTAISDVLSLKLKNWTPHEMDKRNMKKKETVVWIEQDGSGWFSIDKLSNTSSSAPPGKLRPVVLKTLHNDMGHFGANQVTHLTCERFYWYWDIKGYVNKKCAYI